MEAGERKIKALTSKYEIGQREQEIHFLKDKFSAQQREIDRSRMYNITMIFLIFLLIIFGGITFYLYREKRKFNTRLKKINNKVVHQNHELREINNTKDKFFSIIAHDLKGPLNSMTSFSDLLLSHTSSMSPNEIKIVAKDLNQSLKTIYCLMENLFAWARSQTGKIDVNPESFNVSEVLTHSIQLLSNSAQNKGIKINVAKDEHAEVYADKNSVMTILRNLISNAIKFTKPGGLILITVNASKDNAEISVADNGIGMSPEYLRKLFDISVKHHTNGTNNEKGTGLGLVLCKEFVEKNGGAIRVSSEEGRGSTFSFTLPRYVGSLVNA
jgi:signal transduction histidine kinase